MELSLTNLTTEDISKYFILVSKIIDKDFPDLKNKYTFIKIIVFRSDRTSSDELEKVVNDFLGKCISLTGQFFPIRTTANPPKACFEINISIFEKYENWKQAFEIKHECAHLLFKTDQPKTLNHLISKYGVEKITHFVRFQHEYVVHFFMIKKWQEDWLKEPVGFNESMPNPSIAALGVRKSSGRKEAMFFCIQNIVHLMTLLKLYDIIPNDNKRLVIKKKLTAKKYLQSFSNALNVDSKNFPEPRNWFDAADFSTEEIHFQKIEKLLTILDNE